MNEKQEELLEALHKQHGLVGVACAVVGISRKTYYDWLYNDKVFQDRANNIINEHGDYVRNKKKEYGIINND